MNNLVSNNNNQTVDISGTDRKIEEIKKIIQKKYPESDVSQIDKAYQLAVKAHGDQKRRSGEPYIIHPVEVAYILAQYNMDMETVIAALLHDVIEDTSYTYEDLVSEFNEGIAYMVESISKITRLNYQSKEESQAEYIRKMVLSMSNDIRIIIIKLVDRLHNMRTLEYMTSAKQKEKSRETLDIYAPIANRLGIQSIKAELEDLAFQYLQPEIYKSLKEQIVQKREKNKNYIHETVKLISDKLKDSKINAKVYGREKNLLSIYKKMKKTDSTFDEIYDYYAIRIITDSISDCYAVLGDVHMTWNVIPNRMKDYINVPKANGYQSLHTTVVGPNGTPLEIQIRTKEMHETNEYGVAAHWKYKEGIGPSMKRKDKKFDEEISWLRQLIDWSNDVDSASEFLETMKVDIFNEEVYVYTPNGEVVELPNGSCPIDFAYRIHTDVGNSCIGAKVNDKIVPLTYTLQLGDIVTILTSKAARGPSRDWLNVVKSNHAKNKIKQFFKRAERQENISRGREILETEIKKLGSEYRVLLKQPNLEKLARSFNYQSLDDLYLNIGVSSLSTGNVLKKLPLVFPEIFKEEDEELILSNPSHRKKTDILVSGVDNIQTHLAQCCKPIPGDEIVGVTTKSNGISIHRKGCDRVSHIKDRNKLVDVQWNDLSHNKYSVKLFIETFSRQGSMLEILKPFYELNIPIITSSSRTVDHNDQFEVTCEVNNIKLLDQLIKEIYKVPEVLKVNRE